MKIAIIGGGASGMMAAITAARLGAEVHILEHKEKLGKKVLATGNGKCNYCNARQSPSFYFGQHPEFAWRQIKRFDEKRTLAFFEELGIVPLERNGYYYPASECASAVVDVLCMELKRLGVHIHPGVHIDNLKKDGVSFIMEGIKKEEAFRMQADRVILATGGCAYPVHGSDGSGYTLAKKMGHHIIKPLPALTALHLYGKFCKIWQGVRIQGEVRLFIDGVEAAKDRGELQLVNYGISGIPIFQVSRHASLALEQKHHVYLHIDFLPLYSMDECEMLLRERIRRQPHKNLEEQLVGLFHSKLVKVFLKKAHLSGTLPSQALYENGIEKLSSTIKRMRVEVVSVNPFEKAQVCAGGVDTDEIVEKTMASKLVKGLYFAGELIDVDGICGGYNLQWAWTSGAIAAKAAASSM